MNEYNYFTVDVNDDMINVIHTTMVACQIAAMHRHICICYDNTLSGCSAYELHSYAIDCANM